MKHREGGGDGDDAAPPPTTVGGCLTRLVRENGVQTCPIGRGNGEAVSYTHLTLPTIYSV